MKNFLVCFWTLLFKLALITLSTSSLAQAKYMNVRYSLFHGGLLEFAVGNRLGLGVNYNSFGYASISSGNSYSISVTQMGGLISLYSNGMGSNSWYVAGGAGVFATNYKQSLSGIDYTYKGSATYFSGTAGYHWFWDVFNLNLGLGFLNYSYPSAPLVASNGNAGATIGAFSGVVTGLDLGIGLAF